MKLGFRMLEICHSESGFVDTKKRKSQTSNVYEWRRSLLFFSFLVLNPPSTKKFECAHGKVDTNNVLIIEQDFDIYCLFSFVFASFFFCVRMRIHFALPINWFANFSNLYGTLHSKHIARKKKKKKLKWHASKQAHHFRSVQCNSMWLLVGC